MPGDARPRADDDRPVVLARHVSPRGELCLRRHGGDLEIISNGVFLMSTASGASERALVDQALARVATPRSLLLGGLGVGFSLARACAREELRHIAVVEVEDAVVAWHRRYLGARLGDPLDDPRVRLRVADLARWLRWERTARFDAICLDVDNGPDWTVTAGNAALYDARALARWWERLRPGGVLAVWSAHPAPAFAARVEDRFGDVEQVSVPGASGDDHLVLATRPPA